MVNTGSAAGNYALSVANADGRAFMYFCNGTDTDFNFTLFNTGTGEKLVYSVSGKSLDATGYKLNAIKIPFSKFSDPRAVDLGLSVKWATMNIGATKPEEFGDYFAWGATEPWYESGYAQENPQTHWKSGYTDGYTWRNAPYQTVNTTDEDYTKWTKYVSDTPYYRDPAATDTDAAKTVLDLADDAAHANWGGEWRMPTTEEWEEIKTNCTLVSISNYQGTGVAGTLITSKKAGYTDKSIFIPNAGRREHTNIDGTASHGYYWSSSISNFSGHAYLEEIGGTYFFTSKDDRFLGFSVRAVRK